MADAVIELDVSAPWEPPARPGPAVARRRRRWRRGGLGLLVLGLVAGLCGAAQWRPGSDPLWTAGFQVLGVDAGGGRIMVYRYQQSGADPLVQALDARTGRVLWARPGTDDESYAALTDDTVLVQRERTDAAGRYEGGVVGLDAAGGAERWRRDGVRFAGLAGDLVVVRELAWPGEEDGFDTSYGSPDDPALALPRVPHHERYLGLDRRTGATRWSIELAPGTEAGLEYSEYPRLRGLRELDRDGTLRVRDLTGGAVTQRYHLDFTGPVAQHRSGWPGQAVVLPAGRGGSQVFDLATGRRQWAWTGRAPAWNGPVPCLRERYCVFGPDGTDVLDAATGAPRWRLPGPATPLRDTGERLVMYRETDAEDRRTGATAFALDGDGNMAWDRPGWSLAGGYDGGDVFVWRPSGRTGAIIGRLALADGSVHVIGRAPEVAGMVQCVATGGRVACLAVGMVYVWRWR